MQLLKNKIVAVPLENPDKEGRLFLPKTTRPLSVAIPAKVLFVGSQFVHKTEVKRNDIVYVSRYFGDALPTKFFPDNARVYSGDDVLAIQHASV